MKKINNKIRKISKTKKKIYKINNILNINTNTIIIKLKKDFYWIKYIDY